MDDLVAINEENDINILLSTADLGPSFSQSSCMGPRPVFKEIPPVENAIDVEESVQENVKDWSIDLANLPCITQERIHKYLVLGKSLNNEPRGALKHKINGYQLFKEGFVKKLKVKANVQAEKLSFLVKCFVAASMKSERYTVYVHLCQSSGDIIYGKCSCKAGLGGCCKHVAAVLFQLVEYRQLNLTLVPDDKTCTDVLQRWHVPGEGKNDEPIKFTNLTFFKADQNSIRKRPIMSGRRDFCATPLFAFQPKPEKLQKLHDDLVSCGKGLVLAKLIKGNNFTASNFYSTSIVESNEKKEQSENDTSPHREITNILSCLTNNVNMSSLTEKEQDFVTKHLLVSTENVVKIEASTIGQSDNANWYKERKKRLTASNFGVICNRRKKMHPTALLKKLFSTQKFTSNACEWGLQNEKKVIDIYREKCNILKIENVGFIVNPKWPWLGASPDGFCVSSSKMLEIKCPFSKKNETIVDACGDKNFYMELKNGTPTLKSRHNYFYQCQGIMAVTETSELDFIVYTMKDTHIETIEFDEEKWNNVILPELTRFYFQYMMDKVFTV